MRRVRIWLAIAQLAAVLRMAMHGRVWNTPCSKSIKSPELVHVLTRGVSWVRIAYRPLQTKQAWRVSTMGQWLNGSDHSPFFIIDLDVFLRVAY